MSKVGQYLQEHLVGEVVDSTDALEFFSTDMSIFALKPGLIVYPKSENDVRKTTRFTWQLAERGKIIPVTARGAGTDLGGAAIGSGIIVVFPAHLNRILDVDTRSGQIIVEPGANFAKVQEALKHANRYLPPEPASSDYSTIGGAIANNASGPRGFKYDSMSYFVKSLRVVLANGEVMNTGRISKRELSKKLGLATFEGEIYRSLDALIEENQKLLKKFDLPIEKNTAGYPLHEVKRKDGSFDLTPLIVGAQGTLGIVTEAVLESESYSAASILMAGFFDDMNEAIAATEEVRKQSDLPSSLELVDENLLKAINKLNPNLLKKILVRDNPNQSLPKAVLLAEFDDVNERARKKASNKTKKIFEKHMAKVKTATEPAKRDELEQIRLSQAVYSAHNNSGSRPLPLVDDGVVPTDRVKEFIGKANKLFKDNHLEPAMWGHIGDGNLRMQPSLDIGQIGDRQRAFKLMKEYYQLVLDLGGSTSGELNDGRLRAPWLPKVYGAEAYELLTKVKKIFDPYGILNPGVKIDVSLADNKAILRNKYSLDHLYNHTPLS